MWYRKEKTARVRAACVELLQTETLGESFLKNL